MLILLSFFKKNSHIFYFFNLFIFNWRIINCFRVLHWSEVLQLSPTLFDPMSYSLPGSSIHGVFQASVLEWVDISFSRGSSQPRGQAQVARIVGRCFAVWSTREAPWYCIGFYQMSTWISHRFTHVPSYLPPHPTPVGCYQAPVWVPWVIKQIPFGCLFYLW